MTTPRKKIALFGYGRNGRIHAGDILTHAAKVELAAIVDPAADEAVLRQTGIPFYRTPDRVMQDPEIDAVAICTPTKNQADLIRQAALAGKAVFCEKPVAEHPDVILKLMDDVKGCTRPIQIGFQRRFDVNFKAVKQCLTNGDIGDPRIIKIISRDPLLAPIEIRQHLGHIFYDFSIHDFDMLRFLCGDVAKVYAQAAFLVDKVNTQFGEDAALITLTLKSGALANIDTCSENTFGYDQRVEILGSRGSIAAENKKINDTVLSNADGVRYERPLWSFAERYAEAYAAEMVEFIDCWLTDKTPSVGLEDAYKALLIADAAMRSLKSGQAELV